MSDGARVLNRRIFYPGDIIFNEGDLGSQAFVLQAGRVRIVRNVEGGGSGTLGFVEPGGIFGEMALIDKAPRMASAVADAQCTCIVITEETVRTKLEATDPVLKLLMLMVLRLLRKIASDTPIPADEMDALAAACRDDT